MDDIFRSFFGFKNKSQIFDDGNDPRFHDEYHADDDHNDSSVPTTDDDVNTEHFPFDDGRSFTIVQPGDMFRHFENMFASFDKMFFGFTMDEIPSITMPDNPGMPSLQPPHDRRSLREKMLKEPEQDSVVERPSDDANKRIIAPHFFGSILPRQNEKIGDTDMDEAIKSQGIDGILCETPSPRQVVPRVRSAFRSVSVQTRRMPDGKVEERRTSVDSTGNQETLVTRSMDGQTHQQTVRRNQHGEEIVENFTNMSKQEKLEFDRKWNSPSQSPVSPLYIAPRQDDAIQDGETASIFGHLFGFDFPRSSWR